MKMKPKLELKQQLQQVEIHETLRTRCLEVVDYEDQVIARIGDPDSDEDVSEKKIATFFDDEDNEIACLKADKIGGTFTIFGSSGEISISSRKLGGCLSISYIDSEGKEVTFKIERGFLDIINISVNDTQGKSIDLKIDVDDGKVEIQSLFEIESEDKEIRTSQTIFKSAE